MPPTLLTASLLLLALSSAPSRWTPDKPNPYQLRIVEETHTQTASNTTLYGDKHALYYKRILGPSGSNLQRRDDQFEGYPAITYYTYLSRDPTTSVIALQDKYWQCGGEISTGYIELYTIRGGHAWITHRSEHLSHYIGDWRAARLTPTSRLPHILAIESSRLLILEAERNTLTNKLAEPLDIHAAHEFDLDGDGIMEIIGLTPPDALHLTPFHVIKRAHDGSWARTDDPHLINKARHALNRRRDAWQAAMSLYPEKLQEQRWSWWDGMIDSFMESIPSADTLRRDARPFEATKPHHWDIIAQLMHKRPCHDLTRRLDEHRTGTPADWAMLAYCAPRSAAHRLKHRPRFHSEVGRRHPFDWRDKHTQQRAALIIIDALARHGTRRHLPALHAARDALKDYPGAATHAQAARDRMLAR